MRASAWYAPIFGTSGCADIQRARSLYLLARGSMPFATIGASRDLDARWNLGVEFLFVPLQVQRRLDGPTENSPLENVRLQLLYRFD